MSLGNVINGNNQSREVLSTKDKEQLDNLIDCIFEFEKIRKNENSKNKVKNR